MLGLTYFEGRESNMASACLSPGLMARVQAMAGKLFTGIKASIPIKYAAASLQDASFRDECREKPEQPPNRCVPQRMFTTQANSSPVWSTERQAGFSRIEVSFEHCRLAFHVQAARLRQAHAVPREHA